MKINQIDLGLYEHTYSLNFNSHFKDVAEFTRASWNLSKAFIDSITNISNASHNQTVAVLMVAKSQRLLRTINILTTSGYWPEAEIVLRAMFETQFLLAYVLQDKTGKRADKWFSRKDRKEKWPIAQLIGDKEIYENFYSKLSLYPHSHVLSTYCYIQFTNDNKIKLERGPLGGDKNNKKAKDVLCIAAMMNAGICEISASQFSMSIDYINKHKQIMKMPYFLSKQSVVKKFLSKTENFKKLQRIIPT